MDDETGQYDTDLLPDDAQPGEEEFVWPGETALLSEAALARDWLRPEEDAAWVHLQ